MEQWKQDAINEQGDSGYALAPIDCLYIPFRYYRMGDSYSWLPLAGPMSKAQAQKAIERFKALPRV